MAKGSRRLIGNLNEADLRFMRAFRRVADAGGITLAADRDGVEKSTYSRAVKGLEDRLDGALCMRGPGGFELTEYGRSVYAAAASLEDALANVRSEINGARKRLAGELRVGISDNLLTNPDAKISDALEIFFAEAPGTEVSLSVHPPDRLSLALQDRRVHIAILADWHAPATANTVPLFREDYALYGGISAGRAQPVHYDQLRSRGLGIVLRNFSRPGPGADSLRLEGAWTTYASGIEAVATLINTGRCVGFLPSHYIRNISMRRRIVEVPGAEHLRRSTLFVAATERKRPVSQAMRMMLDILCGVMPAERAELHHTNTENSSFGQGIGR